MTIDIRATVTCSLGTLISASVSDDYIQGSGLIKVKGNAVISGILTPDIGTVVTFAYTKGGVTTTLPRKLRVLSSFADPFRRTTTVELGCKLTYLSDLKEPIKWDAFDDSENASYTANDAKIITLPIHASSVMAKCLTELGITASSSPLTNKFSIPEFDFSPGYVQVLSDLLVSESYCGYLDTSEVLQVFSLNQDGGTGPVLDSSSIIDLGPIGVGQLPGEAVTVSYSSLKLKQPDGTEVSTEEDLMVGWLTSKTSNQSEVVVPYTTSDGQSTYKIYPTLDTTEEEVQYDIFYKYNSNDWNRQPEKIQIVRKRKTTETKSVAAQAGALATAYLSNGRSISNYQIESQTVTSYTYDWDANEIKSEEIRTGNWLYVLGGLGLPMAFGSGPTLDLVPLTGVNDVFMGRTVTETIRTGNITKRIVSRYGPWHQTLSGQQSIAEARDSFQSSSDVTSYVQKITSGEYLLDVTISTEQAAPTRQVIPSSSEVTNQANAGSGDAANGYRTESKAELELALGSATAQRRIEFSLPYAPDDTFYKSGSSYYSRSSDAEAKANLYGRVQNKLLLGNRNGMNVQVAPESLPSTPFSPVFVSATGYVALYRTNGTSYTMDANGIVASSDLLFMGGVGTV